ncbi:hypothetical protein V6U90_32590 [Micromonospora sp. CPCC 206060]|uniref:hypothetical protein n=1 Tax=Micromonospora sp. CPCC 206060 TaxID=3122406 RepID=UPI002FEF3FA4
MCGILAFFSARGDAGHRPGPQLRRQHWNALHHHSPDGTGGELVADPSGRFVDAVFAHNRLSIIDVALSHEPLPYVCGRYLLTFNGEIYTSSCVGSWPGSTAPFVAKRPDPGIQRNPSALLTKPVVGSMVS